MPGTWTIDISPLAFSTVAEALVGYYHFTPRFGHSNHVELLVSDDPTIRWKYIGGLISYGGFSLSMFLLWVAILCFFRWRGIDRWGCAAGQYTYKNEYHLQRMRLRRRFTRLGFIIYTILLLLVPIALVRLSLPKLNLALLHASSANEDAYRILDHGNGLIKNLTDIQARLNSVNTSLVDVRIFCGDTFNESAFLHSLSSSESSFDHDLNMSSVVDDISNALTQLKTYDNINMTHQTSTFITSLTSISANVNVALSKVLENEWIIKLFCMFLIGFVTVLLLIGLLNLCLKTSIPILWSLSWFAIPTFIGFIIFSMICSLLFSSISQAQSDFCYVGPGRSPQIATLSGLKVRGLSVNSTIYQSLAYYQSGCHQSNPLNFLSFDRNHLAQMSHIFQSVASSIHANNEDSISQSCGKDMSPYIFSMIYLLNQTNSLYAVYGDIIHHTQCPEMHSILSSLTQAICKEAVYGLSILSVCLQCIVLFGMVMISLRSSLYIIEKQTDEGIVHNKKSESPGNARRITSDSVGDSGVEVILFERRKTRRELCEL